MAGDGHFYGNGLDGSTGRYLIGPRDPAEVYELARAALVPDDPHLQELRLRNARDTQPDEALAVGDPRNLADAGWGVIFPRETAARESEAIYQALRPLLDRRRAQAAAGGKEYFYREYRGDAGLGPGETKQQFLARNGVALGMPADPEYMPYYLLLVGGPDRLSFKFQYELDVEYAVGRVSFDTPDEYARYAQAVIADETRADARRPRRAVFFAARNDDDMSTRLAADGLVPPLATALRADRPGWTVDTVLAEKAMKADLAAVVADPPAVLFTASHGMYFPPADPRHRPHAGALLCSDWPGPEEHVGPIPEAFYYAADDVPATADLGGMVAMHFACFAGGVPDDEDFPHERKLNGGAPLTPVPFVAALPQRLLAAGALAVVGHVERAWTYSFLNDRAQPQVQVFRAALGQLLDEAPVGLAMEWFNQRYAALATALTAALGKFVHLKALGPKDLLDTATLWTGHNDARGYVVLGDPAVRVRPAAAGGAPG